MLRIAMGSVHETFEDNNRIVQVLNPLFPVPSMEETNALVDHLQKKKIAAAHVLEQTADRRVMTKLPGTFSFHFTLDEAVKAAKFMARLHVAIYDAPVASQFRPVTEFGMQGKHAAQPIWGDLNGGNIVWDKGEPVGVVDYDTVSYGDPWYDLATACVLWPDEFTLDYAKAIVQAYQEMMPIATDGVWGHLRSYTLLIHKKLVDAYFGRSHLKKPKPYLEERIGKLDRIYELLCTETL